MNSLITLPFEIQEKIIEFVDDLRVREVSKSMSDVVHRNGRLVSCLITQGVEHRKLDQMLKWLPDNYTPTITLEFIEAPPSALLEQLSTKILTLALIIQDDMAKEDHELKGVVFPATLTMLKVNYRISEVQLVQIAKDCPNLTYLACAYGDSKVILHSVKTLKVDLEDEFEGSISTNFPNLRTLSISFGVNDDKELDVSRLTRLDLNLSILPENFCENLSSCIALRVLKIKKCKQLEVQISTFPKLVSLTHLNISNSLPIVSGTFIENLSTSLQQLTLDTKQATENVKAALQMKPQIKLRIVENIWTEKSDVPYEGRFKEL